jgi:transposase InsO family protein
LEEAVRRLTLDVAEWARQQGRSAGAMAGCLGLPGRTLRYWRQQRRLHSSVRPLGRPVLRSALAGRQVVLTFLAEVGPGIGLPSLCGAFPQLGRAELADLLARYRRVYVRRYQEAAYVLHWHVPGRVWAWDFAEAPAAVEGVYPYVLAVRDLASGYVLLWQPLRQASGAEAALALAALFALWGAPLVLKSDNGSAFGSEGVRAVLAGAGVVALFSPPGTPRYNGSIEAGIGSLKERTQVQSARQGRPGEWAMADVWVAREQANALGRPRGVRGPTPEQAWQERLACRALERQCFAATLEELRGEERQSRGLAADAVLAEGQARSVDREAVRRALVAHSYLSFTRRLIPLPIRLKKAAGLT